MRRFQAFQTEGFLTVRTCYSFLRPKNHKNEAAELASDDPFVLSSLYILNHEALILLSTCNVIVCFEHAFYLVWMHWLSTLGRTNQFFYFVIRYLSLHELVAAVGAKPMQTWQHFCLLQPEPPIAYITFVLAKLILLRMS